jgi:selenide,water dikinase
VDIDKIRLTQYSHGAGCGCKIAPDVLDKILKASAERSEGISHPNLLVGNDHKDDAAAMDIGNGQAILSTTDFFMPIVDDAFDFGRIAATNAISDIYAMGGTPLMAIAILGWPLDKLPAELAADVIAGGRQVCSDAGIPLAGGHSIDAPEPIFGLAVTGIVPTAELKTNAQAQPGDLLYLTKPLGIGLLTTAEKKGLLLEEDNRRATETMCQLNRIGATLSKLPYVHAMTDVTGFGLGGHLLELCQAANLNAEVDYASLPLLPNIDYYVRENCLPGGTHRNKQACGGQILTSAPEHDAIVFDPQTSGGILISVAPEHGPKLEDLLRDQGLPYKPLGNMTEPSANTPRIVVR